MKSAFLLSDLATETLTITCPKCEFERVLDVRLALSIGRDMRLPELLTKATKACSERQKIGGRCGAVYKEIVLRPSAFDPSETSNRPS
jgi:hypothetical protein